MSGDFFDSAGRWCSSFARDKRRGRGGSAIATSVRGGLGRGRPSARSRKLATWFAADPGDARARPLGHRQWAQTLSAVPKPEGIGLNRTSNVLPGWLLPSSVGRVGFASVDRVAKMVTLVVRSGSLVFGRI
jgi:hypothetical protein